jgi:hypothetical protein
MIRMPGGGYGAMAYWNGHVFFAVSDDYLRAYAIKNGQLTLSGSSTVKFANPGATPSVCADGNRNAIVWAIATKTWNGPDNKPAVLYAFDATRLGQPIYTSEQNSQRESRRHGNALRHPSSRQWARILRCQRRIRGLRALEIAFSISRTQEFAG